MRRFLVFLALPAATILVAACAPAQRSASLDGPGEPGASPESWPFEPTEVRLHPLSRAVRDAAGCRVEALVECRDRSGDATRAVGMLWAEAGTTEERRAVEADLSVMDTNAAVWDQVLRVYRLRLELPQASCPAQGQMPVDIRLKLPGGRMLAAKGFVSCP